MNIQWFVGAACSATLILMLSMLAHPLQFLWGFPRWRVGQILLLSEWLRRTPVHMR